MRPEDLDKLFKERLGPSSPTPPADLWNRLQDRIETEMPSTNEQEQKPKGFMWLSYSIAAAIALLLSVGIVFYNVQRGTVPIDGMARNNGPVAEQPLRVTEPAPEQGIALATEPTKPEPPAVTAIPETADAEIATPQKSAALQKSEAVAQATIAKAVTRPAASTKASANTGAKTSPPVSQLVAKAEQPVIPDEPQKGDYYNTGETVQATFASTGNANLNAQPVEIIIKRAVAIQEVEAEEEPSGFEKKQKLAKSIFKQVRNLSNGEKVELSELGINADRIALETQIGKQKISKVINL